MCESLFSLIASSSFHTTFYIYKKNIWFFQCGFNTCNSSYSYWHSDRYPFYKTHHVNYSTYFLKYYLLNGIFEVDVPFIAIKYRTWLLTFWKTKSHTACFVFLICWVLLPEEIPINIKFYCEFHYLIISNKFEVCFCSISSPLLPSPLTCLPSERVLCIYEFVSLLLINFVH